jgi:hypothetical protein
LIEGSMRCIKSAIDLSIYRVGGLDPLQTNFRVNPANLANNRSTKLGTLNCSAHARTVRPPGADRPDRGQSGLRAGPSDLLKMGSNRWVFMSVIALIFSKLALIPLCETKYPRIFLWWTLTPQNIILGNLGKSLSRDLNNYVLKQ